MTLTTERDDIPTATEIQPQRMADRDRLAHLQHRGGHLIRRIATVAANRS